MWNSHEYFDYGTSHELNTGPLSILVEGETSCYKFRIYFFFLCQTINWQSTLIMDKFTKKGSHILMRIKRMSLWGFKKH